MHLQKRPAMELIMAITLIGLLSAVGIAALSIALSQTKLQSRELRHQQIYQVAEAGANYYKWRLAHYPDDFTDGTGAAGPYVHDFANSDGTVIGRYELTITPPVLGSTIATIQSTGHLLSHPNVKKTVIMRVGIPSWSRYAVVANADLRFGAGTTVSGPIHSNGGIRFDGVALGLVTSSRACYDDPDHAGSNEFGVHTHDSPTDAFPPAGWCTTNPPPASSIPNRSDIFQGGRQFPVATVDFAAITADLAGMKADAVSAGIYLGSSGGQGYHVTLNNNDTVSITTVNTTLRCQYESSGNWYDYGYCSNNFNRSCTSSNNCRTCTGDPSIFCTNNSTCSSQGAGTCGATGAACTQSSHSIGSRVSDQSTFTYDGNSSSSIPLPANGIIFLQDDVWVDGTINTARVTIVAARDPLASGNANIYLTNDLRYTNTNGSDAIGLIAQNNILAGFFSEDNLQIDGALIAQNGRVGRPYYGTGFTAVNGTHRTFPLLSPVPNGGLNETNCRQFRVRNTLTAGGSLGTYQRYGFAWVGTAFSCGGGLSNNSGYCTRNLNFDPSLTFAPPPSFPTTGEYQIISFDEIE